MLGHLAHLRRAAQLLRQRLGRAAHRERALLEVARHVQRPSLVAEVALQLAQDRGRGVARELRAAPGLEAVDGLDQAEARDLHEVVERLVGVRVAQRQVAGERQEPLAELLARGEVAAPRDTGPAVAFRSRAHPCLRHETRRSIRPKRGPASVAAVILNLPVVVDVKVRFATASGDRASSPSN